jgi:tRNA threonylcarbamoyl adenosine modification protein YeaZ
LRLLSFDTSSQDPSVALLEDGDIICHHTAGDHVGDVGHEASNNRGTGPTVVSCPRPEGSHKSQKSPARQETMTTLMPMIDAAMSEVGWSRQCLDCLAVGIGPGGFTGIRTGVVTARTIAQALKLPLIPVSSFECLASQCELPVTIVLAAGRGFCFVASYEEGGVSIAFQPQQPWRAQAPLAKEIVAPTYVAYGDIGQFVEKTRGCALAPEVPSEIVPAGCQLVSFPKVKNIAMCQALIAWNRLSLSLTNGGEEHRSAGEPLAGSEVSSLKNRLLERFPYTNVQPLYLRSPSITLKPAQTGNP